MRTAKWLWSLVLIPGLLLANGATAHAQAVGGFGVASERASPSDVAELARDIAKVVIAEELLAGERTNNPLLGGEGVPNAPDIARMIAIERQKELVGVGDLDIGDLSSQVRDWWAKHVLEPAIDIAGNPAASCSLARSMLQRIFNLERQGQILGLEGTSGLIGDPDSKIRQAFDRARQRCLEESFDECMATGSGEALLIALTTWRKQMEMLEITPADWDDRVIYLLRRCAVYKVVYHTTLRELKRGGSAVLDGSYILLLRVPEGAAGPTRVARGRWATRAEDPRDVQLTSLECSPGAKCRQSTPFTGGESCGIVTKQRNVTEWTFTVVSNPPGYKATSFMEWIAGVHVEFRLEKHQEGSDRLVLQFLPPEFDVEEKEPEDDDYLAEGADIVTFYEAVQVGAPAPGEPCPLAPLLIDNDTWVAGSYPTLFSTAHTATHKSSQETTHFDIVHRPDLFPPDEIIPEYELKAPPEPPRRAPPG